MRACTYCVLFHHLLRHCSCLDCKCFITFSRNVSSVMSRYPLLCYVPYGVGMTCFGLSLIVSIASVLWHEVLCVCVCFVKAPKWMELLYIWRNIEGHDMAESVTHQPLSAEVCLWSKDSLCRICVGFVVGKTAMQQVCLQALPFYRSINDPSSFTLSSQQLKTYLDGALKT